MVVKIKIPSTFRRYTDQKKIIETSPGKLDDVLVNISRQYPVLGKKIIEKKGKLKGYIKLFLEEENPRDISNTNIEIKDGDIINIDVTCILDGYYGDTSRMVMIGDVAEEVGIIQTREVVNYRFKVRWYVEGMVARYR